MLRVLRPNTLTCILLLGILITNCLYLASQAIISSSGSMIAFIIGLLTSAVAFIGGLALAFYWRDRRRLVALTFALTFPIASYLTFLVASSFTPERQSQAYALVIADALEQYRVDHAVYPETLDQLLPDYLMDLREPKSIWGWLYEAKENSFLLGYVTYVNWAGYSVFYFDSQAQNWVYSLAPMHPFDLPPTPAPPY